MVRLLLAAMVLAVLLPVSGAAVPIAQFVANAAVFVLFFLNGLRLPRAEVLAGLGNHRLLIPLVLWSYGAMALAGWVVWQGGAGLMPPLLGLGFIFLGVLPSTVQSATAYSSLAGGNVASSVVAAALLNLLGVFISAPLFSLLAGAGKAGFDSATLLKVVAILLVPFMMGQLLQRWLGGWVAAHRSLVTILDRNAIAIAVYVAVSGAIMGGVATRIESAAWAGLLAASGLLLVFAHGGAWLLAKALRLSHGDRIAFLFAGGQKSIAMGAPLATVLFAPDVAGIVLLPILTYHLLQLVLAAPLAARLAKTRPANPEPICG